MQIAKKTCEDKLLQIYFLGLKMLMRALEPDICNEKITPKMVQREVLPFIDLLFSKIEDLNFRAKENSLQTLMHIIGLKVIEMKVVLDKILF